MIKLLTTLYPEPVPSRQAEFLHCLETNSALDVIDEIVVLWDERPAAGSGAGDFLDKISGVEKVDVIPITGRPKYREIFDRSNEHSAGSLFAIANGDVYFDETLALVPQIDLGEKEMLVLSRWDDDGNGNKSLIVNSLGEPNFLSADTWIYKTPIRTDFECDFALGTWFCDSFLNTGLLQAGFSVWNPCLSIKVYHHDADRSIKSAEYKQNFENRDEIWRAGRDIFGGEPCSGIRWCTLDDCIARKQLDPV